MGDILRDPINDKSLFEEVLDENPVSMFLTHEEISQAIADHPISLHEEIHRLTGLRSQPIISSLPNKRLTQYTIIRNVNTEINSMSNEYWEKFSKGKLDYDITGKYLVFSQDRELLRAIAIDELTNHEFHRAQISNHLTDKFTDYTLALFYKDDSRKFELADRLKQYADLKYRYWKSEEKN